MRHVDAALPQLSAPSGSIEPVGAALERVDALRHEVGEDDAVAQRGVFQRRAVGVGDRLHQQPHHVVAGRERTARTAGRWWSPGRRRSSCPAAASKNASTVSAGTPNRSTSSRVKSCAVEGGREREHRVVEADVLQLHDRVGDFAAPIAAAALDHAHGKAVQGDVKMCPRPRRNQVASPPSL